MWKEASGNEALDFLADTHLASTAGGRIPVISTCCAVLQLYGLNTKALDVIEAKVAALCREKASLIFILTNIIINNILN